MANRLIRSIVWFCGLSGVGFGFYLLTPSKTKYQEISKDYPGFEKDHLKRQSKSQQLLDVLEAASKSDKPVYHMSKKELENLNKK